jgi:hypothetical protein
MPSDPDTATRMPPARARQPEVPDPSLPVAWLDVSAPSHQSAASPTPRARRLGKAPSWCGCRLSPATFPARRARCILPLAFISCCLRPCYRLMPTVTDWYGAARACVIYTIGGGPWDTSSRTSPRGIDERRRRQHLSRWWERSSSRPAGAAWPLMTSSCTRGLHAVLMSFCHRASTHCRRTAGASPGGFIVAEADAAFGDRADRARAAPCSCSPVGSVGS